MKLSRGRLSCKSMADAANEAGRIGRSGSPTGTPIETRRAAVTRSTERVENEITRVFVSRAFDADESGR